jgi:uncharacterized membrane protein
MQLLNIDFNKFKVDDSTHVKMLIVQKMWKNSLNHSNTITKHWVACVLMYSTYLVWPIYIPTYLNWSWTNLIYMSHGP